MNAIKFLFAAYIATWVIHGVYLGSLVRRFSRLRQQNIPADQLLEGSTQLEQVVAVLKVA